MEERIPIQLKWFTKPTVNGFSSEQLSAVQAVSITKDKP